METSELTKIGRGEYSSSKSVWSANKAACQGQKGGHLYFCVPGQSDWLIRTPPFPKPL